MDNLSEGLPPWLSDLKKKGDGFKLPADYFESFDQRVLDKTGDRKQSRAPEVLKAAVVNKRSLFKWPRLMAAAAAVAALLVMAWWFVRPQAAPANDLSGEDLRAYILENTQEFEIEQLASIVPEHLGAPGQEAVENINPSQINGDKLPEELRPEDLEHLLDDLSDEELQEIL